MGQLFRGVVLGIAWPVIAAVASPAALANAAPPNLVLVVVDDLGFSDLGSFGSEIRTPHIDALAAEGRRFANFHATGMCAPSRAILMSGEDHHAVGVGNMPESMPLRHRGQPGYAGTLDPNVLTVAQRLRAVGYRNYFVGKWHLGKTPALLPFARGFDRTITLADTGADNYEQRPYMPMDAQAHWFADGQPLTLPADFYSSEYLVDRAIEFIETDAARDQPFFLTLGFLAVHIPLQVPREFSDRYAGKYADGWEHLRRARHQGAIANGVIPADAPLAMMPSMAAWDDLDADEQRYQARRMEIYAGMLEAMDHHLGRLVTHLQRRGDWDNTVVVVLSDNGAEPNDPRAMPTMRLWARTVGYSMDLDDLGDRGSHVAIGPHWASAAAAPGQQYKMLAGEGGIRVPLIIRTPNPPQPGAVYEPFTHVLDIVPTLLDLARGEVPAAMPGRSLRPAIADPAAVIRGEQDVVAYELAGEAAVFRGSWKLWRPRPPLGNGQWQLYDMRRDPGETRDLAALHPEVVAELRAAYADYVARHGVLPVPDSYTFSRQLMINGTVQILERNGLIAALVLALLIAGLVWRRVRRR